MMKAVSDIGGSMGIMMIILGERFGLDKAMAGAGPITSEELSKKPTQLKGMLGSGLLAKLQQDM